MHTDLNCKIGIWRIGINRNFYAASVAKKSATFPQQVQQSEQRFVYTNKKINEKVCTLYGLSEEEMRVVEGR